NAISGARGRILYNFSGSACEGYTSEFRQVSELDSGEGKLTLSDLRSHSWEDAAGKSYRFKIDSRMNDAESAPVDGVAERVGDRQRPDEGADPLARDRELLRPRRQDQGRRADAGLCNVVRAVRERRLPRAGARLQRFRDCRRDGQVRRPGFQAV